MPTSSMPHWAGEPRPSSAYDGRVSARNDERYLGHGGHERGYDTHDRHWDDRRTEPLPSWAGSGGRDDSYQSKSIPDWARPADRPADRPRDDHVIGARTARRTPRDDAQTGGSRGSASRDDTYGAGGSRGSWKSQHSATRDDAYSRGSRGGSWTSQSDDRYAGGSQGSWTSQDEQRSRKHPPAPPPPPPLPPPRDDYSDRRRHGRESGARGPAVPAPQPAAASKAAAAPARGRPGESGQSRSSWPSQTRDEPGFFESVLTNEPSHQDRRSGRSRSARAGARQSRTAVGVASSNRSTNVGASRSFDDRYGQDRGTRRSSPPRTEYSTRDRDTARRSRSRRGGPRGRSPARRRAGDRRESPRKDYGREGGNGRERGHEGSRGERRDESSRGGGDKKEKKKNIGWDVQESAGTQPRPIGAGSPSAGAPLAPGPLPLMPGPQKTPGIIPKIVPIPVGAVLGSDASQSTTNSAPVPAALPPGVHPDRYKTEMCTFFATGACNKGPTCTFAHSESELRKPGPVALPGAVPAIRKPAAAAALTGFPVPRSAPPPEIVPDLSVDNIAAALQIVAAVVAAESGVEAASKPGLCKWYQLGECFNGRYCKYAHVVEDPTAAVAAVLSSAVAGAPKESPYGGVCKWFLKGECYSGKHCRYLHPEGAEGSKGDGKSDEDAKPNEDGSVGQEEGEEPPKEEE
eukprot:TRINITY_DN20503_c0_g1_i1.p1 TRINITY_DN20503_c0_g1~~TRINITY_DN20503_c0_g1_i1.p1  ORF type:complete len:688 (-),score=68.82 TRINITY_DN20503_c0_g1_i1:12-2075(-)